MTRDDYRAAFEKERANLYPKVDEFEATMGFAIDRARLEAAAETLACPLKRNPPCWQHGRVVYAAARRYLDQLGDPGPLTFLDIGTAKGFSALMVAMAVTDAGVKARIVSIDVLDPNARTPRNSVAELDGLKTVREFLARWPEAEGIELACGTGAGWLSNHRGRINFAFVDGKHSYEAVAAEGALLRERQQPADVAIFDDLQFPNVAKAVRGLHGYRARKLSPSPARTYAIAERM